MKILIDFAKGLAIGAGAILPGVSSGVLCVIFGIYEKLLNCVLNFFEDIKGNIKFLLPISIGGFVGIILFGNILKYLFTNFFMQSSFGFIGLILASIPGVIKHANIKSCKFTYIITLFLTFSFSIYLFIIELSSNITLEQTSHSSFLEYVFSGMFMSAGVVIPGVSSTVILMLLGKYQVYLNAISILDLSILFPMGIGLLIGGLIILKVVQFLLNNFKSITYFAITGFVLGSIPVLWPGFSFNCSGIVSILCFSICFFIANILQKIKH